MRSTCLFVILLTFSAYALADTTKFESKLTAMLNMKARASDAVDSVMALLYDLKAANVKEQ
jgi:hypothetical protein